MNQKNKKFLRSTLAVVSAFAVILQVSFPVAFARGIKIPSPSEVAAELEQRYNLNLGSIQTQSQQFNVANQKKTTPEVSLFFSPSDPKPGQKVSAAALPAFFSNEKSDLYFTWYLKRKDCDLTNSPSAEERLRCDADNNGKITVNDWKVEAARIVALNGYDNGDADYSPANGDSDSDGYKALFGGDNKPGSPDRCAVYDSGSGDIYEIGKGGNTNIDICPAGTTPACMIAREEVSGGDFSSGSGSAFSVADTTVCDFAGYPYCSTTTTTCRTGSLKCVSDPYAGSCGSDPSTTTCSVTTSSSFTSKCRHLFASSGTGQTGDGNFKNEEEEFWRTDPKDPGTANNGNKDEANIVGLGRDTFSWTYDAGDKVGVSVEGTSMITTKHDDSSAYIMWAFSKNKCPIAEADDTGGYVKNIRGFNVTFPTADIDLNKCLEMNLVDPAEGGQPGQISVDVSATPDRPVNDETGNLSGDIVLALASLSNSSKTPGEILFEWRVSLANNIQFDNSGSGRRSTDITDELKEEGLLRNVRGNGLSQLSLPMNLPKSFKSGLRLSDYLDSSKTGYIRFSLLASENFDSGPTRKGRGEAILKFQNVGDRINAYAPTVSGNPAKLSFTTGKNGTEICNENLFSESVCKVMKNEIIGLTVGTSGFDRFHWTVNGKPLGCSSVLSARCKDDEETDTVFLPIIGNVGETYTISVDATNIVSGAAATLSRSFRIVDPDVEILSLDTNSAWRRLLGQYKDLDGKLYDDVSRTSFQAFGGGEVRLKPEFSPGFLQKLSQREWRVDGQVVAENSDGELSFIVEKPAGSTYDVELSALYNQSTEIRKILRDFFNISVFDSDDVRFSKTIQVEVVESEDSVASAKKGIFGNQTGLAAIASYLPSSILFSLKVILSGFLILVIASFALSIQPSVPIRRSEE